MATLPTDTILIDPDVYTWMQAVNGPSSAPVVVTDAATYTVSASDSGKLHVVPDLTADITIKLPAEAAGLHYKFIYGGAAADAQDWLITSESDTNYFVGGGLHVDSDAGAGADECVPVFSDGNSNSKLTVLTPQGGTFVELWCDGTKWYVNAIVVSASASALAFADQ
jgi:hypothetical protein